MTRKANAEMKKARPAARLKGTATSLKDTEIRLNAGATRLKGTATRPKEPATRFEAGATGLNGTETWLKCDAMIPKVRAAKPQGRMTKLKAGA